MVGFIKKNIYLIFFFISLVIFYLPFLSKFEIPIPTDTIVGIYHPYRDYYSNEFPQGYPFKNFLITDPVRQTYVWKELSISIVKKGFLPIWNPYEMTGKPLLANFQSGVFYPLNIIFIIPPFYLSWSFFIVIQSILGGLFMILYLKNNQLDIRAVIFGSISFVFSGFFTAWLEWGTVVQTVIWLPLILFSIDKIFQEKIKEENVLNKFSGLLLFSLLSSFFAGHLQSFFYILLTVISYIFLNIYSINNKRLIKFLPIIVVFILFNIVSSIQWIPTLEFINLSARSIDQNFLNTQGFFIPFLHLIQFIAPDFFGNPTTLNYWGTWNYGEMVGYIGIIPLIFALYSISIKRKKIYFFIFILLLSLMFSLPTFLAKLPFLLEIPLISTSQPTRLLLLICFSLSVLSAFGMNNFIKERRNKYMLGSIIVLGLIIMALWFLSFSGNKDLFKDPGNAAIAVRNLILPTALFLISTLIISFIFYSKNKYLNIAIILIILLSIFDLVRFSSKFNTFSKKEFLYPQTSAISFIKNQKGLFRISSVDDRILPPNFSTTYRLHSIEGYDPLYLKSYGQFISAMERGVPNISEPYGFNRIITPSNFNSPLVDFLNVKYILSIDEIKSEKMQLVFEEGNTKVYENKNALERAFFVKNIEVVQNENESIERIFKSDLSKTAVVYGKNNLNRNYIVGEVKVISYSENEVILQTTNTGEGFLVISDAYYPSWHATIDNIKIDILKTNHNFRGLVVPAGKHEIRFYTTLF